MYGDGWTRLMELGIDDVVIKGMNMGEMLARKVSARSEPQRRTATSAESTAAQKRHEPPT
jgi:esterase/lipase